MVSTTTGEQYDVKHAIEEKGGYCRAILPSGAECRRRVNFVATGVTTGYSGHDVEGHWRHNPRPYVNR